MTKMLYDYRCSDPIKVDDFKESLPGLDQIADNLQKAISYDALKIKDKARDEDLTASEREGIAKLTKSLREIAQYRREARSNDKWSTQTDEQILDFLLDYIGDNPTIRKKVMDKLNGTTAKKRRSKHMDTRTGTERLE